MNEAQRSERLVDRLAGRHAKEVAQLKHIISELQAIIMRWLPDCRENDEPWNVQAGDDASGLMCYDGDDEPKYGEQILRRAEKAEAECDRLQEICRNAHDRILRGDTDSELMAFLAEAWQVPPNAGGNPRERSAAK